MRGGYHSRAPKEREGISPGLYPDKVHGSSVLRLLKETRKQWKLMALGSIALVVSTSITVSQPSFVGLALDHLQTKEGEELYEMIKHFLFLTFIESMLSFFKSYCYNRAGEYIVTSLRKQFFSALLRQEIGFFDTSQTGELIHRIGADIYSLRDACTTQLAAGFRNIGVLVGGVLHLSRISPKLTAVLMTAAPLSTMLTRVYGRYSREKNREVRVHLSNANEIAIETISNIRTIRSLSGESRRYREYCEHVNKTVDLSNRAAIAGGIFRSLSESLSTFVFIGVLLYGIHIVQQGELTAGVLMSFLLYSMRINGAISALGHVWSSFQGAVSATERVYQLIDRVPFLENTHGLVLDQVRGDLTLEHVSFAYPSRPSATVLHDVSLRFPSGSVTALVGPSGAGKSSVISLLLRFYDPSSGVIRLDGHDIRTLHASHTRRFFGLVMQEPVLFASCTIRENIRYGRPNATDEQVEAAAKHANAHDFIASFPQGYDTKVGERGTQLSGGQKQRVAIARALLNDPTVLLLDEATSALDSESEHLVQQALERLMVGRTVVIVAHRLSTVQNADKVCLMVDGRVSAHGSHQALLDVSPLYRTLVQRQLQMPGDRSHRRTLKSASVHEDRSMDGSPGSEDADVDVESDLFSGASLDPLAYEERDDTDLEADFAVGGTYKYVENEGVHTASVSSRLRRRNRRGSV